MGPEEMDNLVDTQGAAVYRFCIRLTGNRPEAEELFQQTFLRAVELARRIDRERNPAGFLMAIAAKAHRRNRAKAARRFRVLPQALPQDGEDLLEGVPDTGDIETDTVQRELRQAVELEVQALPDKYRTPVLMLYAGELSVAEIAAATGARQGTVKSRLYKARQIIRAELEAKGYGQEEA